MAECLAFDVTVVGSVVEAIPASRWADV